jgi:hypothetical protein
MTIIVEDGTNVPDANSYINEADFRTWADSLGEGADLPATDPELEALLLNAMYVLEAECWKGERTYSDQALSFPRTGLYFDGQPVPGDEVPQQVIDAQSSLALTANTENLFTTIPAGTGGAVIEERVEGAVTVKYSDVGRSVTGETVDTRADNLIAPFTCSGGALFGIRA